MKTVAGAEPLCREIRAAGLEARTLAAAIGQEPLDRFRAACPEVATSASLREAAWFLVLSFTGLAGLFEDGPGRPAGLRDRRPDPGGHAAIPSRRPARRAPGVRLDGEPAGNDGAAARSRRGRHPDRRPPGARPDPRGAALSGCFGRERVRRGIRRDGRKGSERAKPRGARKATPRGKGVSAGVSGAARRLRGPPAPRAEGRPGAAPPGLAARAPRGPGGAPPGRPRPRARAGARLRRAPVPPNARLGPREPYAAPAGRPGCADPHGASPRALPAALPGTGSRARRGARLGLAREPGWRQARRRVRERGAPHPAPRRSSVAAPGRRPRSLPPHRALAPGLARGSPARRRSGRGGPEPGSRRTTGGPRSSCG